MYETDAEPAAPAPSEPRWVQWVRVAMRLAGLCGGDRTCSSHPWDPCGCCGCGAPEVAYQLLVARSIARRRFGGQAGPLVGYETYCAQCWKSKPALWEWPHLTYAPRLVGFTFWQVEALSAKRIEDALLDTFSNLFRSSRAYYGTRRQVEAPGADPT